MKSSPLLVLLGSILAVTLGGCASGSSSSASVEGVGTATIGSAALASTHEVTAMPPPPPEETEPAGGGAPPPRADGYPPATAAPPPEAMAPPPSVAMAPPPPEPGSEGEPEGMIESIEPAAGPAPNPNVIDGREFRQVRVFYATDRQPKAEPGTFGSRPNDAAGPVSYGSIFVSIPLEHKPGTTDQPSAFDRFHRDDPVKFMTILRRLPKTHDEFLQAIKDAMHRSNESSTFVFVHGFNVSFDEAALRTAQIAFDLDYRGIPIFYSWPSGGEVEDYLADSDNADLTKKNLENFLHDYAQNSGSKDIYLVAHSMGSRALCFALERLFRDYPAMKARFKEVIFAAPDIDVALFNSDFAKPLTDNCPRLTLYVSANDKALISSKKAHAGYVRLGDAGEGVKVFAGFETVDASGLDTSFMAHSYFAENSLVRTDISKIVYEHLRAAQRGLLQKMNHLSEIYWQFVRPAPDTPP